MCVRLARMHVFFFNGAQIRDLWLKGMLQKAFLHKCASAQKGYWVYWIGCWFLAIDNPADSIWVEELLCQLLCSALFYSSLLCSSKLYFTLFCPILPCSTLLCSSEPLCQLPANHRLTCKKPPPIEFPGFFLWLAGSPYLASQCLHVRRTWPPVWIFFA